MRLRARDDKGRTTPAECRGLAVALWLSIPLLTACTSDAGSTDTTTAGASATGGDDGSGGGGSGDGSGGADAATGGSGGSAECTPYVSGGSAAEGDACTDNDACESGVCALYSDVPTPTDAVCVAQPPDCNTQVTGTVFDFESHAPVRNVDVRIVQALQAATDPAGAMAIVEATTDNSGHFDGTSEMPIMSQLGIVAIAGGDGYALTATGVASPADDAGHYEPGTGIHDWWIVNADTLGMWSDGLALDGSISSAYLPLGDAGGVVGLVRDATTGDPVNRVTIVSEKGDTSSIVRYLADDGSWSPDGTGTAGIFVILNPDLGEEFHAEKNGMTISDKGTGGTAVGAVFTLIMDVTP